VERDANAAGRQEAELTALDPDPHMRRKIGDRIVSAPGAAGNSRDRIKDMPQ
jgi:hypothetical protein